jgi:ABC-type transport system involved in cytochrome bd biosynthesis fused ATPase/permease subunit
MVTHEPEDEKHVDRVVWLKDGLVDMENTMLSSIRHTSDLVH